MQPVDTAAVETTHWDAFVRDLAGHLAGQWPAMPERLGERYPAYVEHAVQRALQQGLRRAPAVARYVNLCFVWGPSFESRPGFEWAAGLLAAPPEREWSTLHQLVRRSLQELQRLSEARITPQALIDADDRLLDRFGALGGYGALHPAEPEPAPRRACDLQAVELRLAPPAAAQHYVLLDGQWQRVDTPAPAPLRLGLADARPLLVATLSQPPGHAAPARLHLRARTFAVCDGDQHPLLQFDGTHGRWRWVGHETRAASWPLQTLAQPLPRAGAGSAVAEETSPDIFRLTLQVCGLRDEGDALGSLELPVWVWPAEQWWLEIQRASAPPQGVTPGVAPARRGSTTCRLERDGVAVDAAALRRAFDDGLDAACARALQDLASAWARLGGLDKPALEGRLAVLTGRATLTWGWQLGPAGLAARALLRLLAELDLQAAQAELAFSGELQLGGARARVQLRCDAAAPLQLRLAREAPEPPLLPVLAAAVARFSWPFAAELVPLAGDDGAVLQAAGACQGALVGEAGLRPRTSGGSGFEWYARLQLQPLQLPVRIDDPLLGESSQLITLLPAMPLLDWSLG